MYDSMFKTNLKAYVSVLRLMLYQPQLNANSEPIALPYNNNPFEVSP